MEINEIEMDISDALINRKRSFCTFPIAIDNPAPCDYQSMDCEECPHFNQGG